MPELPEVETVVKFIKPKLLGKSIKSLKIPNNYYNVLEMDRNQHIPIFLLVNI